MRRCTRFCLILLTIGSPLLWIGCVETETRRLSVTVEGSGRVGSAPEGIDCGQDCQHDFSSGTQVTLTATPENGCELESWGGDCSGSTPTCQLELTEDLAVTATFNASEMPIGIPEPDWGETIDPIASSAPAYPENWTSPIDGFYYIDPDSDNATDDDNEFGTPNNPRRSFPSSVTPDSYIEVHGTHSGSSSICYQCTDAAPCWITGEGYNSKRPNFTSRISITNSNYLIVEKLNFHDGTGGAIRIHGETTHHVAVRNSSVKNREFVGNTAAIAIIPDTGGSMYDIVVYNNEFDTLGDWTVEEDLDFHAITPSLWNRDSSTSLYDLWILENSCMHIMGDCVQTNAGNWANAWEYLHHVYIGKNVCGPGRQVGIGTKQASDVIVSQNVTYGDRVNGNGMGGITAQYPKKNLWVIFNEIYGSNFGFRQADTGDQTAGNSIYLVGNLIYDIAPTNLDDHTPGNIWGEGVGIALWHGNLNRYIVDNTIYDTYTAITAIYSGGFEVSGNIIAEIDNNEKQYFTAVAHPARGDNTAYDYNLYYDADNTRWSGWYPDVPQFSETLDEWQTAVATRTFTDKLLTSSGHCSECQMGDPLFVNATTNPATRDFSLTEESPAIGANEKHPVYDLFQNLYGEDIYVDFNGNPRPGANPSIGAFEASAE